MNQADDSTPGTPAAPNLTPNSAPPIIGQPPPGTAAKVSRGRKVVATGLSLFLGLFLLTAVVSVLDDSCVLLFGSHWLTLPSTLLTLLLLPVSVVFYVLMGLMPVVSKRVVAPLAGFMALTLLGTLLAAIYFYDRMLVVDWVTSCVQAIFGAGMALWLGRGRPWRWPLVAEGQLGTRWFSWLHLAGFMLFNLFVLLPATAAYVGGCASLALSHFSEGFVALRPAGIVMQARRYERADGKSILLFPMSHIAETDFYRSVTQTISSNSAILFEGVKDEGNLLTNKLSYRRAAKSLHLAEQHQDFILDRGNPVWADVDVRAFRPDTIAALNLIALVHSEGLNAHTLSLLFSYAPTEEIDQELFDDLLHKRNAHVLEVLRAQLPKSDKIIIPWGAAHMPELSKAIQQEGFHLVETHDYVSIRFGGSAHKGPKSD